MNEDKHNYLFVSDLHLANGIDPKKQTYHPREDFYYDCEFFRFLRWADENQERDETASELVKWELVFTGDCFDFLPVLNTVFDYQRTKELIELSKKFREDEEYEWDEMSDDELKAWENRIEIEIEKELGAEQRWVQHMVTDPIRLPPPILLESLATDEEGIEFRETAESAEVMDKPDLIELKKKIELWENQYSFLPTPNTSSSRLELIYLGHSCFFYALAWWIGRGHRLVMIPGNHDQELIWTEVQDEFCKLLYEFYERLKHKETHLPDGSKRFCSCAECAPGFTSNMDQKTFNQKINFSNSWFYYKPGLFFAEHGHQYEMGNSINNILEPWIKVKDTILLNYPIGSLLVELIVGPLEDQYPEWENTSSISTYVGDLLRSEPLFMLNFLRRNGSDFWEMLKGIEEITGEKNPYGEFPTDAALENYAKEQGLPAILGPKLHDNWVRPLLSYPKLTAALFSKWRYIWLTILLLITTALVIFGISLMVFVISPWITDVIVSLVYMLNNPMAERTIYGAETIISEQNWWELSTIRYIIGFLGTYGLFKGIQKIFGKISGWLLSDYISREGGKLVERYVMPQDYIRHACQRAHNILRETLRPNDVPYFYIMGHDHHPNFFIMEDQTKDRDKPTFYVNAGSWLPTFSEENIRRMRTGGLDNEFTFFKLVGKQGKCSGELLKWNDTAKRVQPQIVPPLQIDPQEEKRVKKRIKAEVVDPLKWTENEILKEYHVSGSVKKNYMLLDEKIINDLAVDKVSKITEYESGENQWLIGYWMDHRKQLLCRIQLRPQQKALFKNERPNYPKITQTKKTFQVTLPVSDGLGDLICNHPKVDEKMKDCIKGVKGNKQIGFVTLEVANEADCDSVFSALEVILNSV